MRLTKKRESNYPSAYEWREHHLANEPLNKLGQLEDIEEELGIDLITLFKALKNGIYAYDHANNIDHMEILSTFYDTKDMECRTDFDGDIFEYDFADYGKTWALTKEELL